MDRLEKAEFRHSRDYAELESVSHYPGKAKKATSQTNG